jgi:hypothetical protein
MAITVLRYVKGINYPLDMRFGGPQSRSGRCSGEKNLAIPGIEPGLSNPKPVSIPTELSRIPSKKSKTKKKRSRVKFHCFLFILH